MLKNLVVEMPHAKRTLGRPRCRWENNIKMEVRETGCDAVD
jgi:hypothetical protein